MTMSKRQIKKKTDKLRGKETIRPMCVGLLLKVIFLNN